MVASQTIDPVGNWLLASLPADTYQRLQPHLKLVQLRFKQPIYEAGDLITDVYFPRSAVVSLVSTLKDGSTIEAGLVGQEGMTGIPALLGGMTKAHHAFVQIAGEAWHLKVSVLQAEFDRGGAFQKLLLRYMQALFTQVSQAAVCNRFHSIEQRLARWLLLVADCLQSESFSLTQEFISQMLGVRRSGVTVAAGTLSQAGLIRYTRGQIQIVDRQGLQSFACECYSTIRGEVDWLYDVKFVLQGSVNAGSS